MEQKDLAVDKSLENSAARLPGLKKEEEKLHTLKGSLKGKLEGLKEGKEKLAEGICPFFREECQNIKGKSYRDIFSNRVNALDKENLDIDSRLTELGKEIKAAENAVKLLDAIKIKGKELERQFKNISKKQEDNKKRKLDIDKIRKNLEEAEKRTGARKSDLERYSRIDAEITNAEIIKSENQAARDTFFANEREAKDLAGRRDSLSKMMKLMEELTREIDVRKRAYTMLEKEYDQQKHAEVRSAKEKLVGDTAAIKQKIDSMNKERLRLEEEIRKMEQTRKEIHEKLLQKKKLEQKEELVKFLRSKIFNNVSAQLSERFREEISLRADIIYRSIAETDEELFWGDRYQIVLRDMQDGEIRERTDDQLSGGQIMSAVVALRLALLQTIGARIAFFDEPTSNLDAVRRANLAHAFRAIDIGQEEVTEHWYDQLFLISHDVNLQRSLTRLYLCNISFMICPAVH
jgi:exonuclease SbcC